MDAAAAGLGQHAACSQRARHSRRVDLRPPPRIHLGAFAVAAGSLLRLFGGLRIGADFLAVWWPHSWYNTRYGMELLPALALGVGFVASFVIGAVRDFKPQWAKYAAGVLFALVALNAWQVLREQAAGLRRRHQEYRSAPALSDCDSSCVARAAGLAAGRHDSDGDFGRSGDCSAHRNPSAADDQRGRPGNLGRGALKAPAQHAAIVLAFDGDAVDRAVKAHPEGLKAIARFTAKGQPSGTLYVSDSSDSSALSNQAVTVIASGKDTSHSGGRLIPFTKAHACGNDFLIVTEEAAYGHNWADLRQAALRAQHRRGRGRR